MEKKEENARGLVVGKEYDQKKHSRKSLRNAVGSLSRRRKRLTFFVNVKVLKKEQKDTKGIKIEEKSCSI